jgi:hypothetical protein
LPNKSDQNSFKQKIYFQIKKKFIMSLNYEKTLKSPNSTPYLAWALNQIITTSFLTVEGDR